MNPVVIVTGASRGIGAATACALACKYGARVLLTSSNEKNIAKVATSIKEAGGECTYVSGDLAKEETWKKIVDTALQSFGQIDTVIHNAGILEPIKRIENLNYDQLRQAIDVNLIAVMMLTKLTLPHVRKQKGRYIMVSSGAAQKQVEGWSTYCVSKSGLNQFNACLALEEPEITTLAFRPGVVDTQMQQEIRNQVAEMRKEDIENFRQLKQQEQLESPEKIGNILAVLALHMPKEMSGQFLSYRDDEITKLVEKYSK